MPSSSSSIRLDVALQAFPQQSGLVQKLSVPTLFLFLPSWIQRWIFSVSFLSFLWPTWKSRHLVLLGSYLYRFEPKKGALKGSPVPVAAVNVQLFHDDDDDVTTLPLAVRWAFRRCRSNNNSTSSVLLCVHTGALTPPHYYAFVSTTAATDAHVWLVSLREARQEAVRRSMGHVADAVAAVPTPWRHWDSIGTSVVQRKERIRRRVAALEMTATTTTDSGMYARGYYG